MAYVVFWPYEAVCVKLLGIGFSVYSTRVVSLHTYMHKYSHHLWMIVADANTVANTVAK